MKKLTGALRRRMRPVIALIIVCITIYSLILPATALENGRISDVAGLDLPAQSGRTLDCSFLVHRHTKDCYREQSVFDAGGKKTGTERVLICGKADRVVHTHDAACWQDGALVCPLEEYRAHTHTAACFDAGGHLICGKEEPHTHTAACYEKGTGRLICGRLELPVHQHTEACFRAKDASAGAAGSGIRAYPVDGEAQEDAAGSEEASDRQDGDTDSAGMPDAQDGGAGSAGTPDVQEGSDGSAEITYVLEDSDSSTGTADEQEDSDSSTGTADELRDSDGPAGTPDAQEDGGDGSRELSDVPASIETDTKDEEADENRLDDIEIITDKDEETEDGEHLLTAEGPSYEITVIYGEEAGIPSGAALDATEITPDTPRYLNYLKQAAGQLGEESTRNISCARFFDISIVDEGGKKIEPAAPVLVNIRYDDETEIETAKDVHVVHFAKDGTEVLEDIGVNADGTDMTYIQDGFSVTGTVVTSPAENDQYMVLIAYDGDHDGAQEYYIVNNDGTLTRVSDSLTASVDVDEPMMWTYDGRNIYHHSEQVSFNSGQVAADFYNKYIDPTDAADGISKDQDNPGTTLRNVDEPYFDWNTWTMQTFTYQVIQNRPQTGVAAVTLAGDHLKSANSDQYLGVVERDGVLQLVGGVSEGDAVTVRLAQADQVLKTNYLNHVVNHIDISIEGEAEADIPLAYGKYYDANGNVILDVQQNKTLHLTSGVVGVGMDDMKRAIITAYTKDENGTTREIDDAFVITGFSANETTAYSTQQVRIEGDFKVADIAPVTQQYYNSNTRQVWADRLAHKIYYSVTAFKTVEFRLIDPQVGQLYDAQGNPMTVKVDVALSASFDFWDKRNECPPVQWDPDWLAGRGIIPDHNMSGMDFVLGGNPEGNGKVRAVEIKKVIVDENGNRISPKTPIQQSFNIYYNPDAVDASTNGEGRETNLRNTEAIKDKGSDAYRDYDPTADGSGFYYQHQKTLRVGEDGVGQLYDYDVNEGVFYISEDTDDIPEMITDVSGDTWYYKSTYIETEYVWRNNSTYDNSVHTSSTYTDPGTESYASRAEVLGRYLSYGNAAQNLDNQFLEFTVYNVYRDTLVETGELDVTKAWSPEQEDEDVREVYLKLYRKAAGEDQEEDVTAAIQAEVEENGQAVYRYFADPDAFDVSGGRIIVKKKDVGAWETVRVKNLRTKASADEDAPAYTYYFREVGYQDADGQTFGNADAYSPAYVYATGSGQEQTVPADGIALANDIHFKVINTKSSTTTRYSVTKKFEGAYPTDGSTQVLLTLEKGYLQDASEGIPHNWTDAGVATVSLPRPYTENPDPAVSESDWFASEAAWTYTWEEIPAVQNIEGDSVPLWYRAKEITPDWFGAPTYSPQNGLRVVPLDDENAPAVSAQKATVTNSPANDTLTVNKRWTSDGSQTAWPDGAASVVQAVRYWHLAEIDEAAGQTVLRAGDVFHTEELTDQQYTLTKEHPEHTFDGLPSYGYMIPDDAQIVEARENGVSLERGKQYLVVYTYGAKEIQVTISGQKIPMDLTVPGDGGVQAYRNDFTSNLVNELTDLAVRKEWRRSGAASADAAWPSDVREIRYSIMRIPVYTMEDGRTITFDAEKYLDDAQTTPLTEANYSAGVVYGDSSAAAPASGVRYTNLPLHGVVTVTGNEQGLVNGSYPVRYQYYVAESVSRVPLANGLSTTGITAEPENGIATLVNEYTGITVEKKWQRLNSDGNVTEADFPEGFSVNWKVVQKASDGSVVDPYYTAYTKPAAGESADRDNRLTKEHPSFVLSRLPARGVNGSGREVTYTYEVYELPAGSEASAPYQYYEFQIVRAEQGEAGRSSVYTITNQLTSARVEKQWDSPMPDQAKVWVQLYASATDPQSTGTKDIKVILNHWIDNTDAPDRGTVTGRLIGGGRSYEFTLSGDNSWTQLFTGLPKYDAEGEEISYTVEDLSGLADIGLYDGDTDADGVIELQAKGSPRTRNVNVTINWDAEVPAGSYVVVRVGTEQITLTRQGSEAQSTGVISGLEPGTAYTAVYEWHGADGKTVYGADEVTQISAGTGDASISAAGKVDNRKKITVRIVTDKNNPGNTTVFTQDFYENDVIRLMFDPVNGAKDGNGQLSALVRISEAGDQWDQRNWGAIYLNSKGAKDEYLYTVGTNIDGCPAVRNGIITFIVDNNGVQNLHATNFRWELASSAGAARARKLAKPSPLLRVEAEVSEAAAKAAADAAEAEDPKIITAPQLTLPSGTGAEHDLTVIDESNLPKDARKIGGLVELGGSSLTNEWRNLPARDGDGNRIYYYVVEEKATAGVAGTTTATYTIDANPDGSTSVLIRNSFTQEQQFGRLEISKQVAGIETDEQFGFTIQSDATGQYLAQGDSGDNQYEWRDQSYEWQIRDGGRYIIEHLTAGNYILTETSAGTKIGSYVRTADSVTTTGPDGIAVRDDATAIFTFENNYEKKKIDVHVWKSWKNADGSGTAPAGAEAVLRLYDGETAVGESVRLDGTENPAWEYTWTGLDADGDYRVREIGSGGLPYTVEYAGNNPYALNGETITNTEDTTSVHVTKRWTDERGLPVTDQSSVAFTLYQTYVDDSGTRYSAVYPYAVAKSAPDGEAVPLTDGRGEIQYASGAWQTVTIENLPKKVLGEDGTWHAAEYFVAEDGIANVSTTYLLGGSGSAKPEAAAASDGSTITIDNRNETTSLTVEKSWDDLGSDTPYTIDFIVQSRADASDEWTGLKESEETGAADREYQLIFNGSAWSIVNKAEGSGEAYSSNTISNLPAGRQYRVVETGYTVGDAISQTFAEDKRPEGSSETADKGRSWTSRITNQLEKIRIEGRKIWKDGKSHADPVLILRRRTEADGSWETLTAWKSDPTLFAATREDPADSAAYTYLQPVWQTREKERWYVYQELPKYDPQGAVYIYEVEEQAIPGFETTYAEPAAGDAYEPGAYDRDIINTPVGNLQVRKVWFAGAQDEEKVEVTYKIEWSEDKTNWHPLKYDQNAGRWDLADNGAADTHTLPVDGIAGDDRWMAVYEALPRLREVSKAGIISYQPIYYRVVEMKVGDADVIYENSQDLTEGEAGFWTVINAPPADLDDDTAVELTMSNNKQMISLSGKKTWVTGMEDSQLPELTLKLISWTDGSEEKEWTAVSSGNTAQIWQYVDLSEGAGDPLAGDAATPRFRWYKNGSVWNYAFTYLPRFDPENPGEILHYRVEEQMAGETADKFAQEVIPGQTTEKGDITNWDFINTEKTSVKVIKRWRVNGEAVDGDPFEPDREINVELYRRGDGTVVTMGTYAISKNASGATGDEGWQLTIPDLPKYYRDANGSLQNYSYYVIERDTAMWHVEYSTDGANFTTAANQISVQDDNTSIYLENSTSAYALPSTGGVGTGVIYGIGAAFALCGGLGILRKRRRFGRGP